MGIRIEAFQYLALAPKEHGYDYLAFRGFPFLDPKSKFFQAWPQVRHKGVAVLVRCCPRIDHIDLLLERVTIRRPNSGGGDDLGKYTR